MLNISEYMEHSYNTTDKYVQAGIKNVDLGPEEILAVVLEMDSIIKD